MKKSLLIIPLLALTSGLLASCGEKEDPVPPPPAHTHEYGSTWRCDAKNHWLECSCGNKKDIAAHIDADKNGKCDVCNYNVPLPHEHKYSDDWKSDETEHWHECSCGDKKDNAAHIDEDENGECDVCGHFVPVFDPNLKLGPASFVDENGKTHNRVTEIVDGGHYLFGYHRATSDKMRFVNAEPHKDDKGEYINYDRPDSYSSMLFYKRVLNLNGSYIINNYTRHYFLDLPYTEKLNIIDLPNNIVTFFQ
mgnify:CR=1 FL=1